MSVMQVLFGFHGRIRRTTYWLAHLAIIGVMLVVGMIFGALGGAVSFAAATNQDGAAAAGPAIALSMLALVLALPIGAALIWSSLALGVKRCHDRDYPGAMILLAFIPFFGGLWALIDLGFIDGTQGGNRYGPSPKGIGVTNLGQVFA